MKTSNTREFKQALAVSHRISAQGANMPWPRKSAVVVFLCGVWKQMLNVKVEK